MRDFCMRSIVPRMRSCCILKPQLRRSHFTCVQIEEQWIRDLLYLCAVGKYKLRQFLAAREQLVEILKVSPESRQAQALKTAVDDKIVQEVRCLTGHAAVHMRLVATMLIMTTCGRCKHRHMNLHVDGESF